MRDSSPIVLRVNRLGKFTPDELEFIISHTKGTLTFEVLGVGSTQSYQDVTFDLSRTLLIGEAIAEFCKGGSFYEGWDKDANCTTINFVLTPQNPAELAKKLHWLSNVFAESEEDDSEEKRLEVLDTVIEFQDQLGLFEKKKYRFPLLLENYFESYIMGSVGMTEDISEVNKDDADQVIGYILEKHSYIQSLSPHNLELEIYCSTEKSTWIILSDSLIVLAELERMLSIYRNSLLKPIELQEASVIATQNFDTVVFNQVEAVIYPFEQLTKAQQCVADIVFLKSGIAIDPLKASRVKRNLLSKSGDILIVIDQMAQYIFFGDSLPTIPVETLKEMAKSSLALKAYLDNL